MDESTDTPIPLTGMFDNKAEQEAPAVPTTTEFLSSVQTHHIIMSGAAAEEIRLAREQAHAEGVEEALDAVNAALKGGTATFTNPVIDAVRALAAPSPTITDERAALIELVEAQQIYYAIAEDFGRDDKVSEAAFNRLCEKLDRARAVLAAQPEATK